MDNPTIAAKAQATVVRIRRNTEVLASIAVNGSAKTGSDIHVAGYPEANSQAKLNASKLAAPMRFRAVVA
jgi:hypothetical protein